MEKTVVLLNGKWKMDYISDTPYMSKIEPVLGEDTKNLISVPVPGYWEDFEDLLSSSPFYSKLSWNPLYTAQRYPQTGYPLDMEMLNPYGTFAYNRSFTINSTLLDFECELYVGGVQNSLSVWINGVYIGRYEGYSAAFFLKIPTNVFCEGENKITLAVSNNRLKGYNDRPISGLSSRAVNECTGGIWGDVELRFYPDGLRDVWVSTAKDGNSFTIKCIGGDRTTKKVSIYDGSKLIFSSEIPARKKELTVSAVGYSHWSPDSPKLYTVVLETPKQSISHRFGIRRLTVNATKLYLNGKPYFFRGTCEHLYQPVTVHPTRDKNYYRNVIRTLKSLGFNSIRFHTWIPGPEYMEVADELGMILEVETPNNTTYTEWKNIVNSCRHFTSVCAYSSGNEMTIDEEYIEHLRRCADYVHSESDSLFSPMSAMRGVEYHSWGDCQVEEPIRHNPKRLAALSEFCDFYNSYSLGLTSYSSTCGNHRTLDFQNAIYKKPILSHEICIHGTYCDLSLEERYRGTRIGKTEFMSSVRQHLEDKGLLNKADIYYRNSSMWQADIRKHCFETVRLSDTFAGYDFLGDIDTHWHTFGYCVGMMNEFYELKPGESKENVLRYNSAAVLLCDLPQNRNFLMGENLSLPIYISNYGTYIGNAILSIEISVGENTILKREICVSDIQVGEITQIYTIDFTLPNLNDAEIVKISARLSGREIDINNLWEIYAYPKVLNLDESVGAASGFTVVTDIDRETLCEKLRRGESVIIFGAGPFPETKTTFQLSIAGRTFGHLATVIADHPIMRNFPHKGYCSWQFAEMINDGNSIVLDYKNALHSPIIDIATTYKNARREALMFECRVGKGRLLVASLNFEESNPAAMWLKKKIFDYAASDEFYPSLKLTESEFSAMLIAQQTVEETNENVALNKNDITM